ncbi:MAG: hypothetical protein LBC67_07450 [Spirochaetales bacterium]|nr:hypothetical protein [Spirochaetales bacterium]
MRNRRFRKGRSEAQPRKAPLKNTIGAVTTYCCNESLGLILSIVTSRVLSG